MSIKDNFLNGGLPLSGISRVLDDDNNLASRALLNTIIHDLTDFFNVGKTMTPAQVVSTSELIVERYHYFKPGDFKLCFKRAKLGEYGKVFDRIDGPTIFSWLQFYDTERDFEIEQIRIADQREFKKDIGTEKRDNDVNPVAEILKSYFAQKKKEPPVVKEYIPPTVSPVQAMHNRWMKQFHDLRKRQACYDWSVPNGLVIKYGRVKNPFGDGTLIHRTLDINSYLQYKQNQYNKLNRI